MNQQLLRDLMRQAQNAAPPPNSPRSRALRTLILGVSGTLAVGYLGYQSLFTVNGGHRAVMFSRLSGVKPTVYGEGTHLRVPWLEWPTVFDIRTRPKTLRSPTGTKDLQTVDISLRVLFKPAVESLPRIYSQLGTNYDERVLPSIANETLKSVVAQFNASQLITQREQVSALIRRNLEDRARAFAIVIDDVSITHLSFGAEYTAAVEAKQVAQQEAERAKYLVKQALQDKRSTIIKAEGEARSAEMIGEAIKRNPGYIELRQLDAAKDIGKIISSGVNRVYLDSDSLLLNITQLSESYNRLENEGREQRA